MATQKIPGRAIKLTQNDTAGDIAYYDGELSLAVETRYAGNGGGAGGGGGGNGGILVFITSSLAKPRIDDGTILFDVSKGDRGQYGQGGGGSTGAGWGTTGYDGELIKIVM